jgi:hypothetical protein
MEKRNLLILVGAVGVCLMLFLVCGGIGAFFFFRAIKDEIDRDDSEQDLAEIASAMEDHLQQKGRTPANLAELQAHLTEPHIAERIRKGEIQVVWSALRAADQPRGGGSVIYAWEAKAGSNGRRMVVFMDAMTRELSESEFQNTQKAMTSKK